MLRDRRVLLVRADAQQDLALQRAYVARRRRTGEPVRGLREGLRLAPVRLPARGLELQRPGLAESLSNVPVPMGFGVGDVPAYAEKAEDKYGGEPWAHVDPEALSAVRFDPWAQYGGRYAPPEHKAEALRRREAKLAETERKREAAAQAEREASGSTGSSRRRATRLARRSDRRCAAIGWRSASGTTGKGPRRHRPGALPTPEGRSRPSTR